LHPKGSPSPFLLSVGDDGFLRGWSIPAVADAAATAAASAAAAQQQPAAATATAAPEPVALQPLFEAPVPRAEPPFPVAVSAAPAAQALAVDARGGGGGTAYVGASDGGCHAFDLARLGAGGGKGGGGSLPLHGHAAAVLGADFCAATGQLATASEVGREGGRCSGREGGAAGERQPLRAVRSDLHAPPFPTAHPLPHPPPLRPAGRDRAGVGRARVARVHGGHRRLGRHRRAARVQARRAALSALAAGDGCAV
jgi:hypothetical protein